LDAPDILEQLLFFGLVQEIKSTASAEYGRYTLVRHAAHRGGRIKFEKPDLERAGFYLTLVPSLRKTNFGRPIRSHLLV
jgi:hypothetical protein